MFLRFYTHFKNLLIKRNDIPHVLTSINQEVFFDQSQFISVVFVSILFSVFLLPLFLGILLYLILLPVSIFCTEIIIAQRKRAEPYSLCHSLFPAWECKQIRLLLNFVPTIDFTSSHFPAYEKRQYRTKLYKQTN